MALAFRYEAFSYEAGAVLHRNDIGLDSSPRSAQMTIVIDIVIGGRMAAPGG